jgi:hypothetical protein
MWSTNTTPFANGDMVRQSKFLSLYHWGISRKLSTSKSYNMAKAKTLKELPIVRGETFYPITNI